VTTICAAASKPTKLELKIFCQSRVEKKDSLDLFLCPHTKDKKWSGYEGTLKLNQRVF